MSEELAHGGLVHQVVIMIPRRGGTESPRSSYFPDTPHLPAPKPIRTSEIGDVFWRFTAPGTEAQRIDENFLRPSRKQVAQQSLKFI
jgi:hypothetical protein